MKIDNQQESILKGYNMLLYFAGSMITYETSEECIVDFWNNGNLKNLPVSSSNPNFQRAALQLRDSYDSGQLSGKNLKEDFLRLFSKTGTPLAPAYESQYKADNENINNQKNGDVTEFYNSYGWVSKFRGKIEDDHLGVEILFLTKLIDKYMKFDDTACSSEMRKEILRFLDNHILTWIKKWNQKVQENSETLCFKGISTLLLACCEDLQSFFSKDVYGYRNYGEFKN